MTRRSTAGGLALLFLVAGSQALFGQAKTTASKAGDLQIGGGFVLARPDYVLQTYRGGAAYIDFDFSPHLGVEAEFHQVDTPDSNSVYERTYEIGARYHRTYGPLVPYVKGMIGRGKFNYPYGEANLAYNLFALGGGADVKFGEHIRLRGEYEFQKWSSFPNGGLDPQLVTIGIAYHFNPKQRFR